MNSDSNSRVPKLFTTSDCLRRELEFHGIETTALDATARASWWYETSSSALRISIGITAVHLLFLHGLPTYNAYVPQIFEFLSALPLESPSPASLYVTDLIPGGLPSILVLPALCVLLLSAVGLFNFRFSPHAQASRVQLKIVQAMKALYYSPSDDPDFRASFALSDQPPMVQADRVRRCRQEISILAKEVARASRLVSGSVRSHPVEGSDGVARVMIWTVERPWDLERRRVMLRACTSYILSVRAKDALDPVDLELTPELEKEIERANAQPLPTRFGRVFIFLRERALWIGFVGALAVLAIEKGYDALASVIGV